MLIGIQNELFKDFHLIALLGTLSTSIALAKRGGIPQPNMLCSSITTTTLIHQLVHLLHRPITHSNTFYLMGNGLMRSFA